MWAPSPVPPSIKAQGGASVTVLSVRAGTAVTLDCESNAIPAPVITWYKNSRLIPDSPALEVLADGQTLRIKAAEVGQAGGRRHLPLLCHCRAVSVHSLVVCCCIWEMCFLEAFHPGRSTLSWQRHGLLMSLNCSIKTRIHNDFF